MTSQFYDHYARPPGHGTKTHEFAGWPAYGKALIANKIDETTHF